MALHLKGKKIRIIGDYDQIDMTGPDGLMIKNCNDQGHEIIKEIVGKGRWRIACPTCGYALYIPRNLQPNHQDSNRLRILPAVDV